jgi:hypothetical protein
MFRGHVSRDRHRPVLELGLVTRRGGPTTRIRRGPDFGDIRPRRLSTRHALRCRVDEPCLVLAGADLLWLRRCSGSLRLDLRTEPGRGSDLTIADDLAGWTAAQPIDVGEVRGGLDRNDVYRRPNFPLSQAQLRGLLVGSR